ncbi:MAG TPA: hypothetical protein VNS58_08525 [Puia sp.]|nr:hypothetical protein [Puia sp.]
MLKSNVLQSDNYLRANLDKLSRTLALIEQVMNSPAFATSVTNFNTFSFVTYDCGLLRRTTSTQLPVYTNIEVLAILLKGHSTNPDGTTNMDLKLVLSNDNGGDVVGETDTNNVTTTYMDWFNSDSEAELAAHYVHEYCHTLGFQHSWKRHCDRLRDCYSVPYAIQHLLENQLTGANTGNCVY